MRKTFHHVRASNVPGHWLICRNGNDDDIVMDVTGRCSKAMDIAHELDMGNDVALQAGNPHSILDN